ncbi:serine hydrolase domain-containing protein [Pseudomonas sp. Marseille-Q8238]
MKRAFSNRLLLVAVVVVGCLTLLCLGQLGLRLWDFHTLFRPDRIVENFRSMPDIFRSEEIPKGPNVYPLETSPRALPESFRFQGRTMLLKDWLVASDTTGMLVLADDKVAYEQYFQGNQQQSQAISWSVGKSFVSALVGIALADGSIRSVTDPVSDYAPTLKGSGYEGVPLQDVLQMASGIAFSEDYADPDSGINKLGETIALGGSADAWVAGLSQAEKPGRKHHYVSVDTQVLGMVLKGATGRSLTDYMTDTLWSRLGVECDGRWLTDNNGAEIAFGGLNLCLRDYARFGLLYLHGGRNLMGEQVVPEQWVQQSVHPSKDFLRPGRFEEEGQPNLGYGYQWWIPQGDEGEFMAVGVYGQFIYVNPVHRVVIAKNSAYKQYNVDGIRMEYEALEAFRAIARSL